MIEPSNPHPMEKRVPPDIPAEPIALAIGADGRLIAPAFLARPEAQRIMEVLSAPGPQATTPTPVRFVGGCVRDALLGRPSEDIDIATPDTPDRVIAKLEAAGIRAVPTGIAHGTVTAIVDGVPFEVTTLRRDVETDGRHAVVAFTDDWAEDARRRDFTMNALFASSDGRLIDLHGGLADLAAGRVRFIGVPEQRIREDHLRILRFFRFHAHYARGPLDPDGLAAAIAHRALLQRISGERIRIELLKLLRAPDPIRTLVPMQRTGVLREVLPEADRLDRLAYLVTLEGLTIGSDPLRRLAALTLDGASPAPAAVESVAQRLRLSAVERTRMLRMVAPPLAVGADMPSADRFRLLWALGADGFRDCVLLAWAGALAISLPADGLVSRWDTEAWRTIFAMASDWQRPTFPLRAADVMALGLSAGPALGAVLKAVEDWWVAGGFAADADACRAQAAIVLSRSAPSAR